MRDESPWQKAHLGIAARVALSAIVPPAKKMSGNYILAVGLIWEISLRSSFFWKGILIAQVHLITIPRLLLTDLSMQYEMHIVVSQPHIKLPSLKDLWHAGFWSREQ